MPGLSRQAGESSGTEDELQSGNPDLAVTDTDNGTNETESPFYTLTVDAGEDVEAAITSFVEDNCGTVFIISATGRVSAFTTRIPETPSETLNFQGSFDIVKLGGILRPREAAGEAGNLTIIVAGREGIQGGVVAGPVIAQSLVEEAQGLELQCMMFSSSLERANPIYSKGNIYAG